VTSTAPSPPWRRAFSNQVPDGGVEVLGVDRHALGGPVEVQAHPWALARGRLAQELTHRLLGERLVGCRSVCRTR
jgi:hypothetical protein